MPRLKSIAKVDKVCAHCHKPFKAYKSVSTTVCPECLKAEHEITCVHCGKVEKYKGGPLLKFLNKDYCSERCRNQSERTRGKMLTSIYGHLLEPKPSIFKTTDCDIEEIIAEQCASIVLYKLYAELEPYYDECVGGMTFAKYLPSTQQYLMDILHYIKVINRILRIEPKGRLVGCYADGRATRYQDQGNWETGPTDEDIKHVDLIK